VSDLGGIALSANGVRGVEHWRTVLLGAIRSNKKLFVGQAIVLVAIGIAALALPFMATRAVEVFIGWLLFIGGILRMVGLARTYRSPGWLWVFVAAAFAAGFGLTLIYEPIAGAFTLTIVLAGLFVIEGVGAVLAIVNTRWNVDRLGLGKLCALVNVSMALLIWKGWPGSEGWAIVLLTGTNLFFLALTLVLLAFGSQNLSRG
jgi:uncharacterized membrane protein HdeD (DUF308 family)